FRIEQRLNLLRTELAATRSREDADDPAHHAPQKVRADGADEDEIAVFGDLQPVHEDARGLFTRLVGGERRKVPHADECAGRFAHALDLERFFDPPHVWLEERSLATRNLIEVRARFGIVTRVKLVRDLLERPDVDV